MAIKVQGRLISRERLVADTNQMVTFYSIHTVKGWSNVNFTEDVNKKTLITPCLVEANVVSARVRTTTTEDGITYNNKSFLVNECKIIESSPEFEAYEQRLLEEKVNGTVVG
jgi:hypothetical protein